MTAPTLKPDAQRAFAVKAVEMLRRAGFEAYWAGGCVRDLLLEGTPKDYDVATSATPREVRKVFRDYHALAVGAAFGVMIIVGPAGAGQLDVATFRSDQSYSDGRRPDRVLFSTAEEDVKRRDFTINGLLYDPIDGKVLDYVGGQEDLRRRVIRAIGDPTARITEDKLRMLRAVRFAARLGFAIDPETEAAIRQQARELVIVSAERITEELRAMLTNIHRKTAMSLCRQVGLLQYILPEAMAAHANAKAANAPTNDHASSDGLTNDTSWSDTLRILAALPDPDLPLALAAMLRQFALALPPRERSQALLEIGRRLRISSDEAQRFAWLVTNAAALHNAERQKWSAIQPVLVHPGIAQLLDLMTAVTAAGLANLQGDLGFCQACLARSAADLNPRPLVTGEDLIALEIPRGRHYQELLEAARSAQLDGELATRDEALAFVEQRWHAHRSQPR